VRLLVAGFVALAVAASASAHTTGTHTGLVGTVSGTEPVIPGLLVQLIGAHERISVRNFTQKRVVIFNRAGNIIERLPPGTGRAWADPRIRYTGPPPTKEDLLKTWRIEGKAGGTPFTIRGFLGYRPPPGAGAESGGLPVWAIVLAAAGGALFLAAALALPLLRREDEDEREKTATG